MRLLFVLILSFFPFFTFAGPVLPATCEVGMPSFLDGDSIKESNIIRLLHSGNWGQMAKSSKYWTAYSDRSHNTTYNAPTTRSGRYSELCFNEEVRIAKIEGDFALVYTEKKIGVSYPQISTEAQNKGWIPMKHLLLWSSCLSTDTGIYQKAIIPGCKDVYLNPRTKELNLNQNYDYPIFFVVKKEEDLGLVLLARKDKFVDSKSMLGWVNTDSIVLWRQRVCLEPNWNPSEVEKMKGGKASVYCEKKKVSEVQIGREYNITASPKTRYRLDPGVMRYPVLGDFQENEGRYKIVCFAQDGDSLASKADAFSKDLFPKEQINAIKKNNRLFAFIGSVDKTDSQTGLPFWKPVLLFTSAELVSLMRTLQTVYDAATTGNRGAYVNSLKKMIRTILPDITDEEMNKKDIKEVMDLVTGLIVKTKSLSSHTILEIQDEKIVPPSEFDRIISDFKQKYEYLNNIHSTSYEFSVKVQGVTWYWLPVEAMP